MRDLGFFFPLKVCKQESLYPTQVLTVCKFLQILVYSRIWRIGFYCLGLQAFKDCFIFLQKREQSIADELFMSLTSAVLYCFTQAIVSALPWSFFLALKIAKPPALFFRIFFSTGLVHSQEKSSCGLLISPVPLCTSLLGGSGSVQSLSCVWLFVTPWTTAY